MFGFFEFFIFTNNQVPKLETFSNPEYQLLIFKKFRNFTDFKNQEVKYLKSTDFGHLIILEIRIIYFLLVGQKFPKM
jgi:hypothetical protein